MAKPNSIENCRRFIKDIANDQGKAQKKANIDLESDLKERDKILQDAADRIIELNLGQSALQETQLIREFEKNKKFFQDNAKTLFKNKKDLNEAINDLETVLNSDINSLQKERLKNMSAWLFLLAYAKI